MIKYQRVIPRDFFNEAKLLKCLGLLSLKILDHNLPNGIDISISENGKPFEIMLSDDGNLHLMNYYITINNNTAWMGTTYNSKKTYPLVYIKDYCEYIVFDESGEFTQEFIHFAQNLK